MMALHGDYVSAAVVLLIGGFLLALTFGFMDKPADDGGLGDEIQMEYEDWLPYNVAMIQSTTGPIEIESGMVHAVGVGEGRITKINGEVVTVTISPAHADLILMNGQSNASYYKQYGDSTFNDGDRAVTPAPQLGTSFYYGYEDSMPHMAGDTLTGCEIRDFVNPDGSPKVCDKGPEFCRTWTEKTGKKALWVSLGIPGRAIEYWMPDDGAGWIKDAQIMDDFNRQLENTGFIVDKTIVLWAQGESDYAHGTTEEQYIERFTALHAAAPEGWGHEIDRWYLISGLTAKIGWVNTVFPELASTIPGVRVATPAALVDSFTLDNGLMADDGLQIHYTQRGDNAVANAAARYALADQGYTVAEPAPIYLVQDSMTVIKGSAFTAPTTATAFRTDSTTGTIGATFLGSVNTATTGKTILTGTVNDTAGLLPYAPDPILEVRVVEDSVSIDGLRYALNGSSASIVGYDGTITTLTAPATITYQGSTYSVNSIGREAFKDCTTLTSADLGAVTEVGNSAFYGCTALETLTAPNVVTVVSNGFRSCSSLTAISLPSATALQGYSFNYCTALESVNIPNVVTLNGYVFRGCTAIEDVILGPLTGTLSSDAFSSWTFYDADGTTVLDKTAANLANSTFAGTYDRLVKVV